MNRDNQRVKVYRIGWFYGSRDEGTEFTLDQCRALIDKAHARYGLAFTGRLLDGRGARVAHGSPSEISLPRWARQPAYILHEAAHAISQSLYRRPGQILSIAPHGPEFARIMIDLYAWAKLDTLAALKARAKAEHVKLAASIQITTRAAAARPAVVATTTRRRPRHKACETCGRSLSLVRCAVERHIWTRTAFEIAAGRCTGYIYAHDETSEPECGTSGCV